jgi:hypothetical protein
MKINMKKTTPEQNKAPVLKAFTTLFSKRDYEAGTRFRPDTYIQHSAHIEPGRDGLFNLIRNTPGTLRYEHQLIVGFRQRKFFTGWADHGARNGILSCSVPSNRSLLSSFRQRVKRLIGNLTQFFRYWAG